MPYYRIRSVETPPSMQGEENLEPFYLEDYTGELKKCKVNPMFSRMNQILLYLYSLVLDASVSVTLHICYHQHELWYIIGVPNTTGYDLPENIYGCRLEEVTDASFLENTYKRTEKFTGGIDPQYLDQRKENILDNFIRLCPDEDFMISTTLGKPADDEEYGRIQKLEKEITYWNKEANKQVSRQGIPFVGKTKSYQETEIVSESIVKNYRHEYYALSRSCCQRPTIVISGNAYVCESFRWLIKSVRKTIIIYNQNMWLQPLEENGEDDAPILPVDYLATLWAFPVNPASGLALIQTVPFGVLDKPLQSGIQLGCLVQGTRTSLPVQIEKNDLTMHAFVTGVTGAGKTSTVKELIGQAFNQKVPSLVLEPAKREYAGFFQKLTTTSRICKLGLPTESFHINPFAFPQGVHIQTHIDHIKSVFIAAFPMYGPMPYIFETALYSIYRQYGWDFITGECRGTRRFPTLDDLYLAVDDATTRVGYSDDLQNDVRGALKVRIQSLMAGAKGHILNREDSTEMSELLAYPTVVELEHIGDPQEKVFIMGLLLMGLYEHYLSDPGKYNSPLRHLLVIEEAHRLLENVQANNNPEIADMKGKSLETFNNILSEIRTYGEGVIIADQIPSKLSPDIIKNTNLKIIHRLYSKEDRDIVGNAIGLTEQQITELIHLQAGEAVVFHRGLYQAVRTQFPEPDPVTEHSEPSAECRPSELVLENTDFIEEAARLFKTALLFQKDEEEFRQVLLELFKQYAVESEQMTPELIAALLKKLYRMLAREHHLLQILDLSFDEFIHQIDKEGSPYAVIQRLLKEIPDNGYETIANVFEAFYPRQSYLANVQLHGFMQQAYNSDCRPYAFDSNEILKATHIKSTFCVSLLTEEEKDKLANCIIIQYFKDDPAFLDEQFEVCEPFKSDSAHIFAAELSREEENVSLIKEFNSATNRIMEYLEKQNDSAESEKQQTIDKQLQHSWWQPQYFPLYLLGVVQIILAIVLFLK